MAVALLFTGLTRHPKIRRAGEKAGWLFVCCLEHCAEWETNGFVSTEAVTGFGLQGTPARLKALLLADERLGPLLHDVPGGYDVNDYLEWNRTAQELKAKRDAVSVSRSAAGKAGAAKRWGSKLDGKRHSKPIATTSQTDSSVSVSGPSGGLDGPSATPKGRASHQPMDHQESQDQDLLAEQTIAFVCSKRPDWKLVLVKGALTKAFAAATSPRRAALALMCVASDPASKQPIRVLSPGWWWDDTDTRYLQALESLEEVA